MKTKKIVFKAINYAFFTYYLLITLAMAGGVSEKLRDNQGQVTTSSDETAANLQFSDYYDFGWEIAEVVYLPLLLINCLLNLILRRKFKESKVGYILF